MKLEEIEWFNPRARSGAALFNSFVRNSPNNLLALYSDFNSNFFNVLKHLPDENKFAFYVMRNLSYPDLIRNREPSHNGARVQTITQILYGKSKLDKAIDAGTMEAEHLDFINEIWEELLEQRTSNEIDLNDRVQLK